MNREKPPRIAEWIIYMISRSGNKSGVLGDIDEEYKDVFHDKGKFRANLWLAKQIIIPLIFFLGSNIIWSYTMFKNYIKVALRNVVRHKGFTFINISGLAFGMACAIIILLWVEHETSWDKFHENLNRLYRVAFSANVESKYFYGEFLPGPLAEYLKQDYPEIVKSTNFRYLNNVNLRNEDKIFPSTGGYVHQDFLEMFSFPVIEGDLQTAFSNPSAIVITEELANKIYGTTDVIGKNLSQLQISAVIKNVPENSHLQFDFLISYDIAPNWMRIWDNKSVFCYVMLQENSSADNVTEKISNILNERNPTWKNFLYLQPVKEIHLHALGGGGGRITYVYIFSLMGIVILVFACINFMNLSTARSETRFKEIGMRKVVGSYRSDLIKQFLFESVLYSVISIVFSIFLSILLLPYFNSLLGTNFRFPFTVDMIFKLIGIAFLTGIISGSYPAFYLSGFHPVALLRRQLSGFILFGKEKGMKKGFSSNVLLRKSLVLIQFSLSILFIICLSAIYLQLNYLKNKDLGFEKENIVVLDLPNSAGRNSQTIKTELLKNTNILKATAAVNGHVGWDESAGMIWEGKKTDDLFDVGRNFVDYDYIETFGLEIAQGRFYSKDFPSDQQNAVVINEAAARKMEIENPVGIQITWAPDGSYARTSTVIGVIRDFHSESLHKEIRPFVFYLNQNGANLFLKIKPDNVSGTLDFIRAKINGFFPGIPVSLSFIEDEINSMYTSEEKTGNLISNITFIAIFISTLGLIGLSSFSAQKRIKEIGIRKILGASVSNIVKLLSREFIVLVITANIISWPVAYYAMSKWLNNFEFKISLSIWIFAASGFAAFLIAFITVSYQSVTAAQKKPVNTLKYE